MKSLEPKVKRKSSFSILLLRDDSSVVRFRVNAFWIRFLVVFFALFSIASGIAGYSAHYYWKKHHTLRLEQGQLTATIDKNRRKLDEFAGMERVEAALPRSSMSSVGVAAVNGNGEAKPAASENGQAPQPARPQTEAPKPDTPLQPVNTAPSSSPSPSEGGTPNPEPPSDPPGSGQAAQPPSSSADPAEQKAENKEHAALIDEVQVRQAGAKRYSLSFGLTNRDKQLRLNGRVHVSVTDNDGKRYEITQINRDALRFIINNYKKFVSVFTLPRELEIENVSLLNLTVMAEDAPNITYSFPMPTSLLNAPAEEAAANP